MIYLGEYDKGIYNYDYFCADFKGKSIILNKKEYPLGYISSETANISKENMTKLIELGGSVKQQYNVINLLGYSREAFNDLWNAISEMMSFMKNLEPFKCFDYESTVRMLQPFFCEDSYDKYDEMLRLKQKHFLEGYTPSEEEARFIIDFEKKLNYAKSLGITFAFIGIDTANFATALQNFTRLIMESDSRKTSDLAQAAYVFFNNKDIMSEIEESNPAYKSMEGFNVDSVHIIKPVIKHDGADYSIVRRIYFKRMMSLFVNDLFEALTVGHYIWQCKICDRYFLMQSAHKQMYCSEVNPEYGVPCSYVAKHPEITKAKMPSQKKSDSPYYLLWKKRADSIRKNKSLGKYDETVSAKAKALIDEYFDRTNYDFEYAKYKYEKDMELKRIYERAKDLPS